MSGWIVGIGASAGGVDAIQRLVSRLPDRFPAPILVVLHFPENARSRLPQILSRKGVLEAVHARNGEMLVNGRIYVAPPSFHMTVKDGRVVIHNGPRENGHRPSIDTLFRSMAVSRGPCAVGVILSGLLDDGSAGMGVIKSKGGVCIAQDPNEAAFADMPRNAIEGVGIKEIYRVDEIASRLSQIVAGKAPECTGPFGEDRSGPLTEEEVRRLEAEGKATQFTCPECGGALYEMEPEEGVRCRVGHAYSLASLEAGQAQSVEIAMWTALRALEENIALNHRLGAKCRSRGMDVSAERFEERAGEQSHLADVLRNALLPTSERHPHTSTSLSS